MKVKELIAALQQQDQEAEVLYLQENLEYDKVSEVSGEARWSFFNHERDRLLPDSIPAVVLS